MAMVRISLLLLLIINEFECKTIQFYPQFHYVYNYSTYLTTESENVIQNHFGLQLQFKIIPRNDQQYVITVEEVKAVNVPRKSLKLIPSNDQRYVTTAEYVEDVNSEVIVDKVDDLKQPFLVDKINPEDDENGDAYKIVFLNESESVESQNIKKSIVTLIEVEYEKNVNQYSEFHQGILGRCFTEFNVIDRQSEANGSELVELQAIRELKDCYRNNDFDEIYSFNPLRFRYNLEPKGLINIHYSLLEESDKVFITAAHSEEYSTLAYKSVSNLTDRFISSQILKLLERKDAETDEEMIPVEIFSNGYKTSIRGNFTEQKIKENIANIAKAFNELFFTFRYKNEVNLDELHTFPQIHRILDQINHLNANDLRNVFHHQNMSFNMYEKVTLFFSVLSLSNNFEALQTAMHLTIEHVQSRAVKEDLKSHFKLQMSRFFTSQRIRFRYFSKEMGLYFVNFCNENFVNKDRILRKACYLSLSRTIDQNCDMVSYRSGKGCDREDNELFTKVIAHTKFNYTDSQMSTQDTEELLLAVQTLANFKINGKAREIIERIVKNKRVKAQVRITAAWSLARTEIFFPHSFQYILLDRKENYEIRIAILHSILLRSPDAAKPLITALKDDLMNKRFKENKNFLIAVYGMLKYRAVTNVQTSVHCAGPDSVINDLYKELSEAIEKIFGVMDQQYAFEFSYSNSKIYTAVMPSNTTFIPRSVYLRQIDPFVEEAFAVRSENGFGFNQAKDLISMGSDFNEEAFESLSKVIAYFRNKTMFFRHGSSQEEAEFYVIRLLDRYCSGFVYKSKQSKIDPNESIVFKGFSLRTDINLYIKSVTESGFRIESSFLQTRIIQNSLNLNPGKGYKGFNGVGGLSKSIGYLPFTNYRLISGKQFEKYFRLNYSLEVKIDSFNSNNVSLGLKLELPSTKDKSYDVFYEEMYSFNVKAFVDDFNKNLTDWKEDEEVRRIDEQYLGVKLSLITKLDNPRPKLSWQRLLLEYDASQAMTQSNYDYKIKVYLPVNTENKDLDINFKYLIDQRTTFASMNMKKSNVNICEFDIKRIVNEEKYTKSYLIKQNINLWNIFTLTVIDVKFPMKNVFTAVINNIEDAIISGKYYFSKIDNEDIENEKNVAILINGRFSKKKDDLSLHRFMKSLKRAVNSLSELKYKVLEMTYDRLELNYNVIKDVMKENNHFARIQSILGENMLKQFADHIQIDFSHHTDDEKKIHFVMDTYSNHYETLSTFNTTNFHATVGYKGIDSSIIPKLMPYTNFHVNSYLFDGDLYSCELEHNLVRTFDGHIKNLVNFRPKTDQYLLAANCRTSDFAILSNDEIVRILIDGKFDIVIEDKSITINSDNITFNSSKQIYIDSIKLITLEKGYYMRLSMGVEVIFDKYFRVIRVPKVLRGKLCGICGDFDGDWSNDFRAPNGTHVTADELCKTWIHQP